MTAALWAAAISLAVIGWLVATVQGIVIKRMGDDLADMDLYLDQLWAETVHEISTDSGAGYHAAHRREDAEQRKAAIERIMRKEPPSCPEQTNHSD